MKNKGILIVISGPSGAGKGTVYSGVTEQMPFLKKSISITTRQPRVNEIDGVHYHFKTVEEYQDMIAKGEFLETAEVYCNFYGTPKAPVFDKLSRGEDVMFEVDTFGAQQIRKKYPECVTIFIMPPNFAELEKRLRLRNTDSEVSIARRLSCARKELSEYNNFDYLVLNDDITCAIDQVKTIISAEKCKVGRNLGLIEDLLKS